MNNVHLERINSQIAFVVSDCVNNKLSDNRISQNILTVTKVLTSADYSYCKIFIAVSEGDQNTKKEVIDVLMKASGFIKKEIASKVKMRVVPKLQFVLDQNADYSMRINEILKNLNITPEENNDETDS